MAKPKGQTDNLADMEDLDEPTLLAELKTRYHADVIYTYVGEILVTVNPFRFIDGMYDHQKMIENTRIANKSDKPPHIFAVSDLAFQQMMGERKNQVCVISGESGAGKTEAAKLFVKQLVAVSNGAEFEGLEDKLIAVNPVLEAFGNAQTGMNDNSSRFGKFTSIEFNDQGSVKGANMTEYLLEKSRVVWQLGNERNFHVFYLFFTGMGTDRRFNLTDPGDYRFIAANDSALGLIGGKRFTEEYQEMMTAFKIIGLGDEDVEDLFHLLSGVLHLGDLDFEGEDKAQICSDHENTATICEQLGANEDVLTAGLCEKTLVVRGESTTQNLRLEQAEDVRDAAAKAIYSKAFSWLIQQCNTKLQAKETGGVSMGILDIFGFETFTKNSFEQLCINLTNEQLQWFFNEHIFAMELAEYAKEGVSGKDIKYENNEPVLNLILQKPGGLFAILDEESNFPKATDDSMILKYHGAHKGHKDYEAPRGNEGRFALKHYAGQVWYEAEGFLEKNRDTLAVDVVGAMRVSNNSVVRTIFGGENETVSKGGKKIKGKRGDMKAHRQSIKHAQNSMAKKKAVTVAANFKSSLELLMKALSAASPHFVRCIKPNLQKESQNFKDDLVMTQLRYTGMLETTRIRREGYSSRPLFADFVYRYKVLGFPVRQQVQASGASCRQIMEAAGIKGYEIGKTKVFMRYFHADELNEKLKPYGDAATVLSRFCRGFAARASYEVKLKAKREQDEKVSKFINSAEREGSGIRDVIESLCEEDDKRPKDYWDTPRAAPAPSIKPKKKGFGGARAASVKWFKEVESKKGAGQDDDGGFQKWFHGIITRQESESLLTGTGQSGAFLIRVAESRFGYSLSLYFKGRIKHFMIDQNADNQYIVVGNERTFPSLNEVVAFHQRHPVTDDGDLLSYPCPVPKSGEENLNELE